MKAITLVSKNYATYLHNCYIDVGGEVQKHAYGITLPEYLLLPAQLAKLMIRIIVESNPLVKGLSEAQAAILKFTPNPLVVLVKNEIKDYLGEGDSDEICLNIEGFARFRLKDYAVFLNCEINDIIKNYVIQEKYYGFLDMLKCYIDENEPISSEMHISSKTGCENSEQILEILMELLPRKLVIYDPDGFKDKHLLRCLEYVFDKRIEYSSVTDG